MIPVDFAPIMREYDTAREFRLTVLYRAGESLIVATALVYLIWLNLWRFSG